MCVCVCEGGREVYLAWAYKVALCPESCRQEHTLHPDIPPLQVYHVHVICGWRVIGAGLLRMQTLDFLSLSGLIVMVF